MKSRPAASNATTGPRPRWLAPALTLALMLLAGRADAQEIPAPGPGDAAPSDIPDPGPVDVAPSEELRIQGPVLSARSPSQTPAPPPAATLGPFGADPTGPGPGAALRLHRRRPGAGRPRAPPGRPAVAPATADGPGRRGPAPRIGLRPEADDQDPAAPGGHRHGHRRLRPLVLQHDPLGRRALEYLTLPSSLLWKPPLANQREPRFYGKFTNLNKKSYIDTAIGAQFGLGRIAPKGPARMKGSNSTCSGPSSPASTPSDSSPPPTTGPASP